MIAKRQRGIIVVLEDLHDPHNVAAILRTCDVFGIQDVVCIYETEKYVNPKRVGRSSSSSANKWLDFTVYRSSTEAVQALKGNKYQLFVTVLDDTAQPLYDTDMTAEPVALVFGNEHTGISKTMLTVADKKIFIPMRGMVQSLNVSVAAAICLSELIRQRMASRKDFSLPAREQADLVKSFLER